MKILNIRPYSQTGMRNLGSYSRNTYDMNGNELFESWKHEEGRPFTGWDFFYLKGRLLEDQPSWSYSLRAAEIMRQSSSVIDLDTGGGERILELREYWPNKVVVTEHYPPNLRLAMERLAPFGVTVVDVQLSDFEMVC